MTNLQEQLIKGIEQSAFFGAEESRIVTFTSLYPIAPNLPEDTIRNAILALDGVKIVGDDGLEGKIEIPVSYFVGK